MEILWVWFLDETLVQITIPCPQQIVRSCFHLVLFKEYTILQYSSICRSIWHAKTLPSLQLTLRDSCKRPFGTRPETSHNIKANCLFFQPETPVSFKLVLNATAALPH